MPEEPPVPPEEKLPVPARTATGVNWVGAFLLYAKGFTLVEVGEEMGIPFPKLKAKYRAEDWENLLRLNRQLTVPPPSPEVSPQSAAVIKGLEERIQANRADALKVAHGLRANLLKILAAYEEAKLFLGVSDLAAMAKAASLIDSSAMLALGDDPSPKILPSKGAEPAKDSRPVTHFHIHPPAEAMRPRVTRGEKNVSPERGAVAGEQVDAILTPSTGRAVVLTPQGDAAAEDVSVDIAAGRASVDFKKLAGQVAAAAPAMAKIRLPDFARAG